MALETGLDLFAPLEALLIAGKARLEQVGCLQCLTEFYKQGIIAASDVHITILGFVGAIRHDAAVVVALGVGILACIQKTADLVGAKRQHALEQVDLEFTPMPCALTLEQCRQNALCRQRPRKDVRHRHACFGWCTVFFARVAHKAAHALGNQVVTRPIVQGTTCAKTRNAANHQTRMGFDAQPLECAWTVVFDQHIGFIHNLLGNLEVGLVFEVKRNAAFLSVGRQKIGRLALSVLLKPRRTPSAGVVTARRFNFDDVRPEVAQGLGAVRSGQDPCEVGNHHARQGKVHILEHTLCTSSQKQAKLHCMIAKIQNAAQAVALDGWLLYDFRGINPLALQLLGIGGKKFLSRRWFLFVPALGEATLIHHRIEAGTWRNLLPDTVKRIVYSSHEELDAALKTVLSKAKRVAMEYSPRGAVPYVSRIDAGTLERVRECGVEIVSSADLLQQWLVWDAEDETAHQQAVHGVVRAKDAAFALIDSSLKSNTPITELEVQNLILSCFAEDGLTADHAPNVSFGGHAGDPHYEITPESNRTLEVGQCVLIDLWAGIPDRPMADVTFVGFAGQPTPEYMSLWETLKQSRDAALALLQNPPANLQGWMVDKVARDIIEATGHGAAFTHRLGHSLGRNMAHGDGANLDNLETHDTRLLVAGTAVTVEPGLYFSHLGLRTEINVLLLENGARVTTPIQDAPYILG
jgi:Xaa-Pro aminopeptidase